MVIIALLLMVYKLVVRHMGKAPHDDLTWHRAPRELAQGSLLAFGLFSAIVAIAAALGSYRIVGWGGGEDFVMILFVAGFAAGFVRSEEHTSELQSLMRISYAVFCLKKKKITLIQTNHFVYYH